MPPMSRFPQKAPHELGVLSRIGWLSRQPADFMERILQCGQWITVAKGERLYSVGDRSDSMYGLAEGLLDVAIPISDDQEVVVHRATPGFWIGDGALLSDVPRTISVEAASDALLFQVQRAGIRRVLDANPGDWMYMHRLSTLNATLALKVLAEVLALPPRARFARLLLRIASPDGSVRATQEELGRMAGMSRAAFRRAFAVLIEAGVVRTEYGGVVICDRAELERQANPVDLDQAPA
jgi:CRP-like cAMP-binding protein